MKQTTFVEGIWSNVVLNLCPLRSFPTFLSSAYFVFQNQLFRKILSEIRLECQTVWIQVGPDLGPKCFQKLLTDDTRRKELNIWLQTIDPDMRGSRGGQGGLPPPPENHKNIVFLAIQVRIPWQITKHSMLGHHRHASKMPFKWHFAGGPMLARLKVYLDPPSLPPLIQNKQQQKKLQTWTPYDKTLWIRACLIFVKTVENSEDCFWKDVLIRTKWS